MLWALGFRLDIVVVAWLALHTLAWLLFYGGFIGVYDRLGLSTNVPRLRRYQDQVCDAILRSPYYRTAFLSGSGARGELNTRSDIDVLVVPGRSVLSKILGILALWGLRMGATVRRLPLEATWVDTERYLPYFERDTITKVKGSPQGGEGGRVARRTLVTLSGAEKEWTRGVAEHLVATWRSRGLPSVLFQTDPEGWYLRHPDRRISAKALFDRIWERIGRSANDLGRYPRMKAVHDVCAWIDYAGLAWRLAICLQPRSIVVTDGYLVDVLARLRSSGRTRSTTDGIFVGLSREPDAAILLHSPEPTSAVPEETDGQSEVRQRYRELGNFFELTPVSFDGSISELSDRVERLLRDELGSTLVSPWGGSHAGVPELRPGGELRGDQNRDQWRRPIGTESRFHKLVVAWTMQYMGWFSLREAGARILLEATVTAAFLIIGFAPLVVLLGMLVVHTILWFVFYGGFAKLWGLLAVSTDLPHLEGYLQDLHAWARRQRTFRSIFIRGSAASGEWNELSDIDLLLVPGRASVLAIPRLWALRAASLLRRLPLEAWWMDQERYVRYRVQGASWRPLFERSEPPRVLADRLRSRGVLITLSGMDGSGKTTAADRLVADLRARGFNTAYFYGHRLSYQEEGEHLSVAIAFRSFWRHVGRDLPELERHPFAKAVFDLCTLVDYLRVRWRLSSVLKPGTIVVTDRYVADVVAFLRFLGPVRGSVEGLLVGTSIEPDISFFFQIDPEVAFSRKQEQTLDELRRFAEAYSGLEDVLGLERVRAGGLVEEVQSELRTSLERKLGIGFGSYAEASVSMAGAAPTSLGVGQGDA